MSSLLDGGCVTIGMSDLALFWKLILTSFVID